MIQMVQASLRFDSVWFLVTKKCLKSDLVFVQISDNSELRLSSFQTPTVELKITSSKVWIIWKSSSSSWLSSAKKDQFYKCHLLDS